LFFAGTRSTNASKNIVSIHAAEWVCVSAQLPLPAMADVAFAVGQPRLLYGLQTTKSMFGRLHEITLRMRHSFITVSAILSILRTGGGSLPVPLLIGSHARYQPQNRFCSKRRSQTRFDGVRPSMPSIGWAALYNCSLEKDVFNIVLSASQARLFPFFRLFLQRDYVLKSAFPCPARTFVPAQLGM
jgi:hypothetical protein